MGTEVAISFSALRTQLENEKSSLFKIDENIKKIVQTSGRFPSDSRFISSGDYSRGGPRAGGRNFADSNKTDDSFGKRKHETKTVFSRLSARTHDSDEGEDIPMDGSGDYAGPKRARMTSAVTRNLPSRAAVLAAQSPVDERARSRNRRMFGSLLGTLQKFKQEEIVLHSKEEKKAQVERKIEEQARQEKEREQRERKTLFVEREQKKARIKALEAKMGRVQEFERWEASQKSLGNFILTRVKPHIYWLPKKMTDKAQEKLNSSRKFHEKCMAKKRQELQDELQRIEQRCLRTRGAKENEPRAADDRQNDKTTSNGDDEVDDEKARKRDKFAMDVDEKEKEDSEGEERHDNGAEVKREEDVKVETTEDIKPDSSKETEPTAMETDNDNNIAANDAPVDSQEANETTIGTTNETTTGNATADGLEHTVEPKEEKSGEETHSDSKP